MSETNEHYWFASVARKPIVHTELPYTPRSALNPSSNRIKTPFTPVPPGSEPPFPTKTLVRSARSSGRRRQGNPQTTGNRTNLFCRIRDANCTSGAYYLPKMTIHRQFQQGSISQPRRSGHCVAVSRQEAHQCQDQSRGGQVNHLCQGHLWLRNMAHQGA